MSADADALDLERSSRMARCGVDRLCLSMPPLPVDAAFPALPDLCPLSKCSRWRGKTATRTVISQWKTSNGEQLDMIGGALETAIRTCHFYWLRHAPQKNRARPTSFNTASKGSSSGSIPLQQSSWVWGASDPLHCVFSSIQC
jgi:hypothetical protein